MPAPEASPSRRPFVREKVRFEDARGVIEVGVVAPGIVFQEASGHASAELAQRLCGRLDELVARHGRVEIFDDWYGVTGYDPAARQVVQAWTAANRSSIERIHVLLSSKLVAMAISVSNLVTDGATVGYGSRPEFERVLDEALARRAASRA